MSSKAACEIRLNAILSCEKISAVKQAIEQNPNFSWFSLKECSPKHLKMDVYQVQYIVNIILPIMLCEH